MGVSSRTLIAGLAAAAFGLAVLASSLIAAPEGPRTISLFNIHSKETVTVVYKRNGAYVPEAMKQVNWVLRDWRRNEATTMDPALIDLIWEVHNELGSREPVHIISGFRSRATNDMLRKTGGGQASQSRHILGKAADVHFPDVPLRQLRYSALIRERGGVGYYPTSAIPFVHLDTDRVRHWPRIPRHELALLFPNGRSKHVPAGGPLTPSDVRTAREKKDLVTQVAEFLAARNRPRAPVLVADARGVPAPRPAAGRPAGTKLAAAAMAPRLVGAPRPVERPSRLAAGPSLVDRGKLDRLVAFATYETAMGPPVPAALGRAPGTVADDAKQDAPTRVAALTPPASEKPPAPTATDALEAQGAWVTSPAFDEEHPEELSYRPFPVAPMLTLSPSPDDPVLTVMRHPDLALTLDMIDDEGSVPPMRFRPGQQVARLLWAQQFQGNAVGYETLPDVAGDKPAATGVTRRTVTTSIR